MGAACLMKHDAIVAVLIEGRANVNAKDRAGFTAVSWLLNPKDVDSAETLKILRTLIKAGRTALMHAVQRESPEVVRVLFDARADASAQDAKGFTPSTVALSSPNLELREILQGGPGKKRAPRAPR